MTTHTITVTVETDTPFATRDLIAHLLSGSSSDYARGVTEVAIASNTQSARRDEAKWLVHAALENLVDNDPDIALPWEDLEVGAKELLSDIEADTFDDGNKWSWQA